MLDLKQLLDTLPRHVYTTLSDLERTPCDQGYLIWLVSVFHRKGFRVGRNSSALVKVFQPCEQMMPAWITMQLDIVHRSAGDAMS